MRYKNQTIYFVTGDKLTGKNVRKASADLIDILGGDVSSCSKSVYGAVRADGREWPVRRIAPNRWKVIGDGDSYVDEVFVW